MKKQAVVLLGHGSKSQNAIDDFNFIVDTLKDKIGENSVWGAHMELAQPSLEEVIANINNQNQTEVIILPYFLFNGNHIKEDIPEKISALQEKYPNLKLTFGTPIGKEPMMADIMLKKISELS